MDVEESLSNMFLFMPVVVVEECVEGEDIQYGIFTSIYIQTSSVHVDDDTASFNIVRFSLREFPQ